MDSDTRIATATLTSTLLTVGQPWQSARGGAKVPILDYSGFRRNLVASSQKIEKRNVSGRASKMRPIGYRTSEVPLAVIPGLHFRLKESGSSGRQWSYLLGPNCSRPPSSVLVLANSAISCSD